MTRWKAQLVKKVDLPALSFPAKENMSAKVGRIVAHSYQSVRTRWIPQKHTRNLNNAQYKLHHWQGHRSMLFPAFAKIPNSPYLIKRLLALDAPADL